MALQNVRSYGTEGREKLDPDATFVGPQDSVHPYLLFRGCDIKDLHVHESASQKPPTDPAIMSAEAPSPSPPPQPQQPAAAAAMTAAATPAAAKPAATKVVNDGGAKGGGAKNDGSTAAAAATAKGPKQTGGGKGNNNQGNNNNNKRQQQRKPNPANQIGTGASLLNRKVRGTKDGGKAYSVSILHETACRNLLISFRVSNWIC